MCQCLPEHGRAAPPAKNTARPGHSPTHRHAYVYCVCMANVTIYLDDSLKERVRLAGLPVSRICQRALRSALDGCNPTDYTMEVIPGQTQIDVGDDVK